jgi:hypothetical protein
MSDVRPRGRALRKIGVASLARHSEQAENRAADPGDQGGSGKQRVHFRHEIPPSVITASLNERDSLSSPRQLGGRSDANESS